MVFPSHVLKTHALQQLHGLIPPTGGIVKPKAAAVMVILEAVNLIEWKANYAPGRRRRWVIHPDAPMPLWLATGQGSASPSKPAAASAPPPDKSIGSSR